MRTIERQTAFRKDWKREQKGQHGARLEQLLRAALVHLVEDQPLPAAFRDHALAGEWKGFRDCHLRPDLVLIYSRADTETLVLARLGSHAELFG